MLIKIKTFVDDIGIREEIINTERIVGVVPVEDEHLKAAPVPEVAAADGACVITYESLDNRGPRPMSIFAVHSVDELYQMASPSRLSLLN